ncbi:MAG: hypothetical protein AAGB01_07650 [Cyanobacteria bacterium P01_F01_bin.42]
MTDTLPIFNIPLLFTQYRTRILEESGRPWFHSEYCCTQEVPAPVAASTCSDSGVYEYPDPWESPGQMPEVEMSISSSIPVSNLPAPEPKSAPSPPAAPVIEANDVETSDTSVEQGVTLFPLESDAEDNSVRRIYDLTEFDNGEIEAPPVAVRASQPSRFEKVPPVHKNGARAPESQDDDSDSHLAKKAKRPQPSSAEIAKYRLRNCL